MSTNLQQPMDYSHGKQQQALAGSAERGQRGSIRARESQSSPSTKLHERVQALVEPADIRLNGGRPWDPRIHDDRALHQALTRGNLGVGESYMDGDWDCDALDEMATRFFRARIRVGVRNIGLLWEMARATLINLQSRKRAGEVGRRHYDIGNDLFSRMLDPLMIYSCGYWAEAKTLEEAQRAKLDLVCRKLNLQPGQRVLDIGCGWGGALQYAAENYGVEGVGVTISKEQAALAEERLKDLPVEVRIQDYRQLEGQFDHIFSIGMFEHVGPKNYRTFMETSRRLLKPNGMLLLHTIGENNSTSTYDAWMDRYIFPNAHLPSPCQITQAIEGLFVMEDWHNFGTDYDKTLMSWYERFQEAWPELEETGNYDERFRRMWRFYLLNCAAVFRARVCQLWQVLLSPRGMEGGMRVPR